MKSRSAEEDAANEDKDKIVFGETVVCSGSPGSGGARKTHHALQVQNPVRSSRACSRSYDTNLRSYLVR